MEEYHEYPKHIEECLDMGVAAMAFNPRFLRAERTRRARAEYALAISEGDQEECAIRRAMQKAAGGNVQDRMDAIDVVSEILLLRELATNKRLRKKR